MENKASIDAVYYRIEREEQKRNRLALIVAGISISSIFGLAVNTVFYMYMVNQKGSFNDIIILFVIILLISIYLAGLAAKKFISLRRLNHKLARIGELEETIYNEVLRSPPDNI